jgi:SAM-dependent methyltransferase
MRKQTEPSHALIDQRANEGPNLIAVLRDHLPQQTRPSVLELGSRDVTGDPLCSWLFDDTPFDYTGFDYHEGPNVDVVGDAHTLSRYFEPEAFDVIVSKSVFEHLAIPWKVVLECNVVLRTGGLVLINTFQSFPLHERPWDFFRFSDQAWKVLFNQWTGFEIIATELNMPCQIIPDGPPPPGWVFPNLGYVNSNVLARKVGDYDRDRLRWDLSASDVLENIYPAPG